MPYSAHCQSEGTAEKEKLITESNSHFYSRKTVRILRCRNSVCHDQERSRVASAKVEILCALLMQFEIRVDLKSFVRRTTAQIKFRYFCSPLQKYALSLAIIYMEILMNSCISCRRNNSRFITCGEV